MRLVCYTQNATWELSMNTAILRPHARLSLLVCGLLFAVVVYASPSLTAGNRNAVFDSTVDLVISFAADAAQVREFQFDLSYDANKIAPQIAVTTNTLNANATCSVASTNLLHCEVIGLTGALLSPIGALTIPVYVLPSSSGFGNRFDLIFSNVTMSGLAGATIMNGPHVNGSFGVYFGTPDGGFLPTPPVQTLIDFGAVASGQFSERTLRFTNYAYLGSGNLTLLGCYSTIATIVVRNPPPAFFPVTPQNAYDYVLRFTPASGPLEVFVGELNCQYGISDYIALPRWQLTGTRASPIILMDGFE
jgi:hypothetical protein